MPGLSHSEAVLAKAGRELRLGWEATAPHWRDRARAELEKGYIDEFLPAVKSAVRAIERVNGILMEAISKCS